MEEINSSKRTQKRNILIGRIAVAFGLIVIWETLGLVSNEVIFYLGSPYNVFRELVDLLFNENLLKHFALTGLEALGGLLIGSILGSCTGLFLWYKGALKNVFLPYLIAIASLPIFAFAPLLIVWFGIGILMKFALASFATFFNSLNQAISGAESVQNDYIDTYLGADASPKMIFWKIILPGSMDWVLNSMRVNVGNALLGAFIGEFISSNQGLGYLILRASGLYNVSRALAASIGIIVLALIFDYLAKQIVNNRHLIIQKISISKLIRNQEGS